MLGSGLLVLEDASTLGVSMLNSCAWSRKWFIRNSLPEDAAALGLPCSDVGRSGEQEKLLVDVTSNGFSKTGRAVSIWPQLEPETRCIPYVNSSSR